MGQQRIDNRGKELEEEKGKERNLTGRGKERKGKERKGKEEGAKRKGREKTGRKLRGKGGESKGRELKTEGKTKSKHLRKLKAPALDR